MGFIVAAEATRKVRVAKIVLVGSARNPKIGKYVFVVNREELLPEVRVLSIALDVGLALGDGIVEQHEFLFVAHHERRVGFFELRFGDRAFSDGVDMVGADFYRLLRTEAEPASTAAPAPGRYLEAYRRITGAELAAG